MRAKAQKLALLTISAALAVSSLLAPAAFARPHKPAHAAAAKPPHKKAAKSERAAPHSKRAARPEPASARSSPGRASRKTRAEASRHAAPTRFHSVPAHAESKIAQARQPAPEPVAPQPALPPIEVHHNRKQHLKPVAPPLPDQPPQAVLQPTLYTSRGHLIVLPPLKGSHDILIHQNVMADSEGLERIQDDADLDRMRAGRTLVPIPAVLGLQSDERLPLNRRYCRPWTAQFLTALARAHYARFHSAIQVNSAVRTVEFQHQLLRVNGNAAPAEGDTASPHLTGQAVDLAKHGLSMTEIAWMRAYLLPLVQQGKIDVEEEFQQSCFHISIYKRYVPAAPTQRTIDPHTPATALATALP
jgi:hypothetical protein